MLGFSNKRMLNVNGLSDLQIAHLQAIIQDIQGSSANDTECER